MLMVTPQLQAKSVIICSTARLVRGVLLQHQRQQQAAGLSQWHTIDVCTFSQWLARTLSDAQLLGNVPASAIPNHKLSALAEAHLWQQAIASCIEKHEAAALFDIRALAESAIEANQRMYDWQISETDIEQQWMRQESRQFLRWRHTFQALCQKKNAIEASRLDALHIELMIKYQCILPQQIKLAGFDRITPLQQSLFDHLGTHGVVLSAHDSPQQSAKVTTYALSDSQAECRAAVAWAKHKLQENPNAQLAIISPSLGSIRRTLADLLDDTFHPHTLQPAHVEAPRCYDFSLGLALSEYALVNCALTLLKIACHRRLLRFDEWTPLLQDRYWGTLAELDARAQLDAHLRRHLSANFSLETMYQQAQNLHVAGRLKVEGLLSQLEALLHFQQQAQQHQLPSQWVQAFVNLLQTMQWASHQSLSSHEYQAQQAFVARLKELADLDAIFGAVSASEAIHKLVELCHQSMFQPEAKGDTQLQILGLLETPAVKLDAVWALNMNDQYWPPPVNLNPLLPAELQRNRGTPNASAKTQHVFASLVQARLLVGAPEIVFSYALKEDERELRPSPLLDLDTLVETPPPLVSTLAQTLAQPAALEMLNDSIAPAVTMSEKIRGGVKLFATQAVCPAWAFYQYRLGAKPLDTPVEGLDSMARGSLLHKVLQCFWQACKTQQALKAMTYDTRTTAITKAIHAAVNALQEDVLRDLPPAVLNIEQQRLMQLMHAWLGLEAARADFVVLDCEQSYTLDIAGLNVQLTIDRVDQLAEGGGLVVIDYKTGSAVSNKSWADDRIAEPQLPIYASLVLQGQTISVVCFAKVRSDEVKFIGLSAEAALLPEVSAMTALNARSAFGRFENWDALLHHWQVSLNNIAHEITTGVASVTFSQETALNYCDVKPLLRLPERLLQFERAQAALSGGREYD